MPDAKSNDYLYRFGSATMEMVDGAVLIWLGADSRCNTARTDNVFPYGSI
jgi:hypothetical protein